MPHPVAAVLVFAAEAYLVIGLVAGFAFLMFGIDRVDASARGAYAFRPLLLPGLALLWPYVLVRWARLARARAEGHG
jgi:hypothetical protein